MITAEVSVVPVGVGTSVGRIVKSFIQLLRKSGLKVIVGPASTAVEARNTKELFEIIDKAHNQLFDGSTVKRLITTIKIDDRRDKNSTLEYKLKAIQ